MKQLITFNIILITLLCLIKFSQEPLYIFSKRPVSFLSKIAPLKEKSMIKKTTPKPPEMQNAGFLSSPSAPIEPPTTKPTPPEPSPYNPYPTPKRITLSYTDSTGNYQKPLGATYSKLELLLAPDYKLGSFIPMLDLQGFRFSNATYEVSAGLIGRYIPEANSFCDMLGVNLFYDYRQGNRGYFNQLGGGLEVLGKRLDFRANFYAPFGSLRKPGHCNRCGNGWFAFLFNAEIGYLAVRSSNFLLYTAIGPYYTAGKKCQSEKRGAMLRIVPQYKDYAAIDCKLSYDAFFKTVFQVEFIVSIPLYQIKKQENKACGITNRQIYQRVERF